MDFKDEFNYHAVTLIFGLKNPHVSNFKIFSQDVMRKYKNLQFKEVSVLTPENILDIKRELKLTDLRSFIADHCKMSSGVCRIITLVDVQNKIHISDAIFSDSEYDYFLKNWDDTVKNKIRTLGMLFRSVTEGKLMDVPLLINEFPNITNILFKYPEIWIRES